MTHGAPSRGAGLRVGFVRRIRAPRRLAWVAVVALAALVVGGAMGCRASEGDEPRSTPEQRLPDVRGLDTWAALVPRLRADRLDAAHQVDARDGPLLALAPPGRPAVFALWATYCAPCLADLPVLQRFAATERATVVGVSMDGPGAAERVRARLAEADVRFPNAVLTPPSLEQVGQALDEGLPFAVLIDASGHVREVLRGSVDRARLDAALTRLDAPRQTSP